MDGYDIWNVNIIVAKQVVVLNPLDALPEPTNLGDIVLTMETHLAAMESHALTTSNVRHEIDASPEVPLNVVIKFAAQAKRV